ncbi:hypothetical protein QJS04_geneDACA000806 [Acorus gramineus]|uniref:Reverse transcriptase n=1 Tax=Acorus gramineus TaxID=55184 RepID=A0AAV9BJ86_ACOGR|nr:hypothetical protein QJS04_geneDACA000806 [Acorus gramineus]
MASKLKILKGKISEWSKQIKSIRRARKDLLEESLRSWQIKEEGGPLTYTELEERKKAKEDLLVIFLQEEEYRRQRSRALWLKSGDGNSKFFHRTANSRRRQNLITSVMEGDFNMETKEDIENHIGNHFRSFFRKDSSWLPVWHDDSLPQLSEIQRLVLDAPFTEEVKTAVLAMEGDKAPGPGGFSVKFFQQF